MRTKLGGGDLFVVAGYHAVKDAVSSRRFRVNEVIVAAGRRSRRQEEILELAERRGLPVSQFPHHYLDALSGKAHHQGFLAVLADFRYAEIDDMLIRIDSTPRIILALDHITDEGNLGAIIRTAAFFGANGLILPKDRSASITPFVFKRSSGGCLHLPIARVVNLERELRLLKERGFWVVGAAGESSLSVYGFDWGRDVVLVLGNEERGLGQHLRKSCDSFVSIPGGGKIPSLNVSVAAGIILGLINGERLGKGGNSGRTLNESR